MNTLLGESDASHPLQWWGYSRGDGEVVLKRFRSMAEVERIAGDTEVPHTRGPRRCIGEVAGEDRGSPGEGGTAPTRVGRAYKCVLFRTPVSRENRHLEHRSGQFNRTTEER